MFGLRRNIDFFLRNKLIFSRKNYEELNEEKDNLGFTSLESNLESVLVEKYNFKDYKNNSTIVNYLQNLYTLALLDKYLSVKNIENMNVLDIGSKNWFYAPAQYYFFKKYSKNLVLDGVELDAYRLYSNLYNRFEVANFYIKNLDGANYIPDNLLNIDKKYDYIIWILPFVLIEPLRRWGLPDRYFRPKELFEHAYSLLKPEGKMLIINQGEEEYKVQKSIVDTKIEFSEKVDIPFYKYKNSRYATIVGK